MAVINDKVCANVEALLDMLFGDDIGGRVEVQESGALATHEACLGCNENRVLWGYCPECEDTGGVSYRRVSAGDILADGGMVEYKRDEEGECKRDGSGTPMMHVRYLSGEDEFFKPLPPRGEPMYDPYLTRYGKTDTLRRTTPANDAVPEPSPHRPTPVGEHVPLTTVERDVSARLRVWVSLRVIARLLNRAPDEVRLGAVERSRVTVEWLATRMRYVPNVA